MPQHKDWDDAGRAGENPREAADKAWEEPERASKPSWRDFTVTAAKLHGMEFPPVRCIVPGLLPEGLSILAGRPKIGKSWLALDVCLGVASDEDVLGNIKPVSGSVLYCALEDTERRLKSRLDKLIWPKRPEWPAALTLATKWRKLDAGGVDDIADWAATTSQPRLVMLDTLAGVRPERQQRDTNYDGDYKALIEVHRLANEKGFAAVALHHTRKMEAEDPLDTVSGTLGLVGCADTVLVLARTPQGASLYVRGRDIEEGEHAISFSKDTCRWTILGEAADVRRSDTRNKILAALLEAESTLNPAEIANLTGIKRNNVDQRLAAMLKHGEITLVQRGRYCHPSNVGKCQTP